MKKIVTFVISFLLVLGLFSGNFVDTYAIFSTDDRGIIYCSGNDCSLQQGVESIRGGVKDIDTQRSASEFVMDVVRYLLTFVTILAVVYVIYAGFKILTSAGDEETNKNSKKIIISVSIGIVVMWLAYSIIDFVLRVITSTS